MEMEIKDLTPHGYPGYSIREDGRLFNSKGRAISGNVHGQVRLVLGSGLGTEWKHLSWLVATAFISQKPGHMYVRFKDGNKNNIHKDNLEWTMQLERFGPKRQLILKLLNEGSTISEVASRVGTSSYYVRGVAAERFREMKE